MGTTGIIERMKDEQRRRQFEQLLREHQGIVLKVASLYAWNAADRQDLAQEIGAQLWRSFDRYDEARGRFSTWMYRVALNVAISELRRGPQPRHHEPLEQHHLDTIAAPAPAAEDEERIAGLYRVIAQLEPLNRALILLYLDEHSHAEIAEIVGISATNVATKIGRIKQTLRGRIGAAGEGA